MKKPLEWVVRPGHIDYFPVRWSKKVDAAKNTRKGWLSWGRSESQASINDPKRRVDETQEAWILVLGSKMPIERPQRRVKILSSGRRREQEFRDRIAKAIQRC